MERNLKKTNTLFHTLRSFDNLKQIIADKGFKASYADEIISGMNVKILMISFSNVALFEAETQINYGKYSIGLNLKWGKEKGLQPVLYTYENSYLAYTFFENYAVAAKDYMILKVLEDREKGSQNFGLILDLKKIAENSMKMLLFLKQDIVKDKKGNEFKAYNDREWRFVYEKDGLNSIIFQKDFFTGSWITQFEDAKSYSKPYTKEPVLPFDLNDIKYVITDTLEEKKEILNSLFNSFGKEQVLERILNGELDLLSRSALWDDI